MLNPFSSWSRLLSAGADMQQTWFNASETMRASGAVISARTDTMRAAAASPMTADIGELARMVPEKIEAFSRSGLALMHGLSAMHTAWWEQGQLVAKMMTAGRLPTAGEWTGLAEQSGNYALESIDAGARLSGATLAPVHDAATANARRLKV